LYNKQKRMFNDLVMVNEQAVRDYYHNIELLIKNYNFTNLCTADLADFFKEIFLSDGVVTWPGEIDLARMMQCMMKFSIMANGC